MTKSIGTMLKLIDGLCGTKDCSPWEESFIKSCMETSKNGTLTAHLSGKQVEIIERIHDKNFA